MTLSVVSFALLLLAGPLAPLPDDMETSYQNLKNAQAGKDVAQVKKLAAETSALARQAQKEPMPAGVSPEEWNQTLNHAKEVDGYTEYALSLVAAQSQPAETLELLQALEQQNPKSKYLDRSYERYFYALRQTGATAKIVPMAEKAVLTFPNNEDLLAVVADNAMTRKQTARAGTYAERLIVVLERKPPEGVTAAEWERKKTAYLGRARWIAGAAHMEKGQDFEADKDLRVALPLVKDNQPLLAEVLFRLGVVNYNLGRNTANKFLVIEAQKFSEQAAAIPGPLAKQAWQNAQAMRTAATQMR